MIGSRVTVPRSTEAPPVTGSSEHATTRERRVGLPAVQGGVSRDRASATGDAVILHDALKGPVSQGSLAAEQAARAAQQALWREGWTPLGEADAPFEALLESLAGTQPPDAPFAPFLGNAEPVGQGTHKRVRQETGSCKVPPHDRPLVLEQRTDRRDECVRRRQPAGGNVMSPGAIAELLRINPEGLTCADLGATDAGGRAHLAKKIAMLTCRGWDIEKTLAGYRLLGKCKPQRAPTPDDVLRRLRKRAPHAASSENLGVRNEALRVIVHDRIETLREQGHVIDAVEGGFVLRSSIPRTPSTAPKIRSWWACIQLLKDHPNGLTCEELGAQTQIEKRNLRRKFGVARTHGWVVDEAEGRFRVQGDGPVPVVDPNPDISLGTGIGIGIDVVPNLPQLHLGGPFPPWLALLPGFGLPWTATAPTPGAGELPPQGPVPLLHMPAWPWQP